ncbi:ribonucleotide-diphosphate reductase subunit alpha [Starkeya sp. ORNL1]|uniref:sugar dehydrogenase complex small subunit n=1 Tax=Starkeya sp. ORNL1 TaxID=2709380 RepID=UPI001462B4F0|nr:sugar dehydrogenase complex small subunit [Starkeya sp. ORNL1]QJP17256.1 ribonucleotide-diphosphate reductase subunit alpha [Starkeya sp. ORNL1]
MPPILTRRDAILGALAAALATAGSNGFAAADGDLDVNGFLALSTTLTGAPASLVDRDVATTLLGGFIATGNGDALKRLVADPTSDRELGDAIVAAWYSGVYSTGKGEAVATFDHALVWQALSFTKAPGNCGGETGYWSQLPG